MTERDLVLVALGTRPEAIKLLPVIRELSGHPDLAVRVVATGQHREMVDQILAPFGMKPDYDLEIMRSEQTLNEIVCRVIPLLERLYAELAPKMVLVQGDTTSAFAAALAAFHRRISVGHVEAGLRTFDRLNPFPEETNRRMISSVADLHLAATPGAAKNLLREGIPPEEIVVTGNTVIDSLLGILSRPQLLDDHRLGDFPLGLPDPLVLITLHRRENWLPNAALRGSSPLEEVLLGIRDAAEAFPKARFVYPVHRNPRVQEQARRILGERPNVHLLDPLAHIPFVDLMSRSTVILTDSGGIQEEAPSLGVPVLVARETTERPEAVTSGANRMVGTDRGNVGAALRRHLEVPVRRPGTWPFPSPYGDGQASARIREAVLFRLGRGKRPSDFRPDVLPPPSAPSAVENPVTHGGST
ncbi:MAG TPA: UDP-N-acetylglucosamine 2-epimerase (non-hydrolyzing) [Planctomycetota bacterium]|nr:UDP-N-acetylglucosamine 2-epimerase (non-hydrolyzing) [Planctomycetota bacterium]